MKKLLLLLLNFPIIFLAQQKIKIIDSETSKPIPNVRAISNQNIYYSNDEGYILFPDNPNEITLSTYGFKTEIVKKPASEIALKPKYQDIDEVKIVSIDFVKILKDVSNHYSEIYYDRPLIYEVTVKQRSFENDRMKLLMIADGEFWTIDGKFHPKEAFNNKFDNFVQLQIDDLRYLKTEPNENFIRKKTRSSHNDVIGDLFFSYELIRTASLAKMKNAKASGKLISDDGTEQEISFMIKTDSGFLYQGNMIYNKIDKAILHFDLNFNQSSSKPAKLRDENGVEYLWQLGDGILTFDLYKSGNKYFPSKIGFVAEGFKTIVGEKTFESRSAREIIFKSYKETDKKGLSKPVEIDKSYWNHLKISSDKGEILLTKEEEQFISKKSELNQD